MSRPYEQVTVVTGGIGSGKSTFVRMLAEGGALVVSADELARQVVARGSAVLEQIKDEFGAEILLPDGTLDRKTTASIIFADPEKRSRLEAITHPEIQRLAKREFEHLIEEAERQSEQSQRKVPVIYDCPLYFEADLSRLGFREVVLVDATPENCRNRIMKRDGVTQIEAERKIQSQMPMSEKRQRADRVVENNADISSLRQKAEEYLRDYQALPPKRQ